MRNNALVSDAYKRIILMLINMRLESGVTQMQIAKKLGLNQSDISKIEKCQRRLDVLEFLEYLGCLEKDPEKFADKANVILNDYLRSCNKIFKREK